MVKYQLEHYKKRKESIINTGAIINSVPSDSLSSFNHVTAEELKSIAKGFKDGKVPGADNIPISIIKKTLDLISDPLLSIINLSLSSGVFPDRLKISKIIPIFKSDNASLAQNYRPISVLPASSKIFERAVYLSNRPHFPWVYRRDNTRGMLGEHGS